MVFSCACMALAVLLFQLCTPGGPAPWLAWVAMAPFFAALNGTGRACPGGFRGVLLGGGYAFFGWLGASWWTYVGMRAWLELDPAASALGVAALCAYGAVPYAAYGALHWRLGNGTYAPVAQAALLTALEGIYPLLLPGNLAHSLYRMPLFLQPLEIGGMPLLFFLLLLVNALVARGLTHVVWDTGRFVKPVLVATLLMAVLAGFGAVRMTAHPPVGVRVEQGRAPYRIGLVQAAIPVRGLEADVEERDRANDFANVRQRTRALLAAERGAGRRVDLVVWPETPGWLDCDLTSLDAFRNVQMIMESDTWLMTQCARRSPNEGEIGAHNAAVLHDPTRGPAEVYAKRILMPFSEYLPMEQQLPWLRTLLPRARRFVGGHEARLLDAGRANILPALCYEAGFAAHARAFAPRNAVLVVQSDDAWFGDTPGLDWNFALALMRTVELRIPMARVANTGLTAVADAAGRIVGELERGKSGSLVVTIVPGGEPTLFARWGNWFLWAAWLLGAIGLFTAHPLPRGKDYSSERR